MKKLISLMAVFALMSTSVFAAFDDVSSSTDYNEAIDWMADNGVINGYGDGSFGPDNCVQRAEMLKMLFETLEIDETESYGDLTKYTDVPSGEWFTDYVQAASALGVVEGYGDGYFKPGQCVSRAEAMKMAILQFNDGEIPEYLAMFGNPYDVAMMKNEEEQSYWWINYFDYAMSAYIVGTSHFDTYDADWSSMGVDSDFVNPTFDFDPNGSMSRKEVAEMLYRMKTVRDSDMDYYDSENEPDDIVTKFDGCGTMASYEDEEWFDDLQTQFNEVYLPAVNVEYEVGISDEYGEGCLGLDGSQFIFIPSWSEGMGGCGQIYSYDVDSDELVWSEQNEDNPGAYSGYCADEFFSRVGNYVTFSGGTGAASCSTSFDGKYYFEENYLEVEKETVCTE
jgi:hypothetical protein